MRKLIAYVIACCAAFAAPLVSASRPSPAVFTGWPTHFEGRVLTRLADTPEERRFYADVSVRHARFSDGERIILMRWTDERLEGFHLAEACYRAFGFAVGAQRTHTNASGRPEICFRAERAGAVHDVCEHIVDADQRVFLDTSSFHVARLLRTTRPPYLGISVVRVHEPVRANLAESGF